MPHLEPIWNDWRDSIAFPGTDFHIASRTIKWREAMRLLTDYRISIELGASNVVKSFLQG